LINGQVNLRRMFKEEAWGIMQTKQDLIKEVLITLRLVCDIKKEKQEKQRLLFEALKDIKDEKVNFSLWSMEPNCKIETTRHLKKEYSILQKKLINDEDKEAFRKIQNDTIETVITEIMIMIDGYGALPYSVDLIDKEKNESLRNCGELHDGFMSYLYENEEQE
jgi:hypothetical protein